MSEPDRPTRRCGVCQEPRGEVILEWCPLTKDRYCPLCHVDCEECRE